MKREEILAYYLYSLEKLNHATLEALNIIKSNSEFVRNTIEELIFEENESYNQEPSIEEQLKSFYEQLVKPAGEKESKKSNSLYFVNNDDINEVADYIIKEIKNNEYYNIDISIDPYKINPFELMNLVNQKIAESDKKEDDGFDFSEFI